MPKAHSNVLNLLRSSPHGERLLLDPIEFMRASPESLLFHQVLNPRLTIQERLETQRDLIKAEGFENRKRYALRLPSTFNGEVCVKLRQQKTLSRLFGPRHARNEYHRHQEVLQRGFAATRPLGFDAIKDIHGHPWEYFIQEALPTEASSGESLLNQAAKDRVSIIASELAKLHQAQIFHGDLKPYHVVLLPQSPHWLYLDLDPVRFGISRRRRIVNLYQALRYFLDGNGALAEPLVQSYAEAFAELPSSAISSLLDETLKLLHHKMETHRGPELID